MNETMTTKPNSTSELPSAVPIGSGAVLDCCPDWPVQIEKVNGPIVLQSLRAGLDLYDGIPFRYCPWCGKKRPEQEKQSNVVREPSRTHDTQQPKT